jgi:hypothetical protein
MIGHVIMEIEPDEMRTAVAFYLNRDVFMVEGYPSRVRHEAIVANVRQRSNGNFVVEFDGQPPIGGDDSAENERDA